MTPFIDDGDIRLYVGDALDVLRGLPDGCVDACVTSPPYWGLRDYGVDGQLGLEATPDAYVAGMVAVFGEVRRVLADAGTLWLNLGDSYATGTNADRNATSTGGAQVPASWAGRCQPIRRHPDGLKPKDLIGAPWRVAFALQADGWYLRSDIIWAKPNPMPESVTDRPTKSHEYVFLLSKGPRYFFDQEAVREAYVYPDDVGRRRETAHAPGQPPHSTARARAAGPDGRKVTAVIGKDGSEQHRNGERWPNPTGRNVRSVWSIATEPYPDAHFATFPQELARRCILAGSAPGGTILDPFAGSGTTGLVARKHGRRALLIELNPDYAAMAARRLSQLSLLGGAA